MRTGVEAGAEVVCREGEPAGEAFTTSSAKVPNLPHSGQRPSHEAL